MCQVFVEKAKSMKQENMLGFLGTLISSYLAKIIVICLLLTSSTHGHLSQYLRRREFRIQEEPPILHSPQSMAKLQI